MEESGDAARAGGRAALGPEEERLLFRLKSDYSCGICFSILSNAVATPCGHLFCAGCLRQWEQMASPATCCPKCRRAFRMENAIRMYSGSSASAAEQAGAAGRLGRFLERRPSVQCRRLSRVYLYESEFGGSLSVKSTAVLVLICLLVVLVVAWILKA